MGVVSRLCLARRLAAGLLSVCLSVCPACVAGGREFEQGREREGAAMQPPPLTYASTGPGACERVFYFFLEG